MDPHPDPALAEALLENAPWVRRLARRLLRDEHLAADVSQEVLLAALRRPPARAGDRAGLRAWLRQVTRNLSLRAIERERARPGVERRAARPEADRSAASAAERLRLHRRLTDLVLELDEPYRTTLVLRFFDDLAPREIARRQKLPPATVRKRLSRGLEQLRARLDRQTGGDRGAWCVALAGLVAAGAAPRAALLLEALMLSWKKTALATAAVLATGAAAWVATRPETAPLREPDRSSNAVALATPPKAADDAPAGPEAPPPGARVAAAAPASAIEPLAVEVLSADGAPVEGALVLAHRGDDVLALARTASDGVAELGVIGGSGNLLAAPRQAPSGSFEAPQLAGRMTLQLSAGLALSGRVSVDGALPREPLELELRPDTEPAALSELPEAARERLRTEIGAPLALRAATDPGGRFHFFGLPADWSGRLSLPQTHWILEAPQGTELFEERTLALPSPRAGLQLEATELPILSGRVLQADGTPAARARLTYSIDFEGREGQWIRQADADEQGKFQIGLEPLEADRGLWRDKAARPAMRSGFLHASTADGSSFRGWTIQPAVTEPPGHLGDLVLPAPRVLFVRVRTPEGTPIPGAVVGTGGPAVASTDEEGRAQLATSPLGEIRLLVAARGFGIRHLESGSETTSAQQPLEVELELEPAPHMEIRLARPDGGAPPGVAVELESPRPLHDAESDAEASVLSLLQRLSDGRSPSRRIDEGDRRTYAWSWKPASAGAFELIAPRPGIPMTLRVLDPWRFPIAEVHVPALSSAEHRVVEVLVDREPFEVRGRITDPSGRPLPHTTVELAIFHPSAEKSGAAPPKRRTRSDGGGWYAFEHAYADGATAELRAFRPGWAPGTRSAVVGPGSNRFDVVLEPGLDVQVEVVDTRGRPVEGATLEGGTAETAGPGRFVLRDLPDTELRLEARLGGRSYPLVHPTTSPRAVIEVPVHGVLRLALDPALPLPGEESVQVRITALDDPDVRLYARIEGATRSVDPEAMTLLPGEYEIAVWRSGPQSPGVPVQLELLPSQRVEIRANETKQVLLGGDQPKK